jgi:Polyketide cyclase / dehydrase and lipid transport
VIRVEREIDVERSADEVFDRLIRIEDLPHWQPAILEAGLETPPPPRVGSQIRVVADVAGKRTTASGTITRLERPARIGLVAKAGSADVEADVSITPTGDASCRVALATSIRLGGLLVFVEGMARSQIEKEAPAAVAAVKEWLERDGVGTAATGTDGGQTRTG